MRSTKIGAGPLESQHLPTGGAAATAAPTRTVNVPPKVVGALALALAASLLVQNVVFIRAGAPSYADPIEKVFAFHHDHRAAVAIAVGSEALNVPLLLGFVIGLHGIVGRRAGAIWSRLAVAAAATLSAVFALYAVLWDGVVLYAGKLSEPNPEFELVWQLHAAAFALALPALGTVFIAAGVAAHAITLTPRWQLALALGGGGLLVLAGTANLAIADGSSLLLVGMPGYFAWLVWLLATGTRLMRRSSDEVHGR